MGRFFLVVATVWMLQADGNLHLQGSSVWIRYTPNSQDGTVFLTYCGDRHPVESNTLGMAKLTGEQCASEQHEFGK